MQKRKKSSQSRASETKPFEPVSRSRVILAAGGILWHPSKNGPRLAVIRRNRYGEEWTLPKGKLEPKEGWEEAARREVSEETGYRVQCGPFAGGQVYQVGACPKVVLYWHMTRGRPAAGIDRGETREVRWLTVAEALVQLTHPTERHLLVEALQSAPTRR